MIGIQTKALLLDAYRDLNSRKMFWVVLLLNVIVVAGFSAVGVTGNRISIFSWRIPQDIPIAQFVYKWIFTYVIVGRWLTWAATIMALISTASIFPEFMAGGAIDLYLSKPIGRLRLFLTKYLTGLLFVGMQVTVFTIGSFIVLGTRGHTWEPGLFLAIPIVLLFFSYLFSMQVLFGVLTRSTLASFFMTLIAWFLIFGINQADAFLMRADDIYREQNQESQQRIAAIDKQIAAITSRGGTTQPSTRPTTGTSVLSWFVPTPSEAQRLSRLTKERERIERESLGEQPPEWVKTAQPILFGLNTLVPKTQDTIGLLDRVLFTDASLKMVAQQSPERGPMHGWRGNIERLIHGRSKTWILTSSIAFELVVLAAAAWRFARRDY